MKKLAFLFLLMAALSTPIFANDDPLVCRDGVIISGSDRYCAPPPSPPAAGDTTTTTPDGTLLLIEIIDSAWLALSLL